MIAPISYPSLSNINGQEQTVTFYSKLAGMSSSVSEGLASSTSGSCKSQNFVTKASYFPTCHPKSLIK